MTPMNLTITRHRRLQRRGFNLVELLIALAITSALLTSVLVALNASFMAYQATTEVASTHTIGRLTVHRILAMIRTGKSFEPNPDNPVDTVLTSYSMTFEDTYGQVIKLEWDPDDEALYVTVNDGEEYLLLEGVMAQYYPDDYVIEELQGQQIMPFTLEYNKSHLYRATIDFLIKPDDNMHVTLDGNNVNSTLRLVASAMPRGSAY